MCASSKSPLQNYIIVHCLGKGNIHLKIIMFFLIPRNFFISYEKHEDIYNVCLEKG